MQDPKSISMSSKVHIYTILSKYIEPDMYILDRMKYMPKSRATIYHKSSRSNTVTGNQCLIIGYLYPKGFGGLNLSIISKARHISDFYT